MARIAFACLTAITLATAGSALAQTTTDPAAPMTAQPAAPPSMAAPPMAPPPMTAPPMAAPGTPAAPAVAEPAPAPAPPALPTEGIGAQVLSVLDKVCLAMIRQPGSDPKAIAKATGFKNNRGQWMMKIDKVNSITVNMPSAVNPSACTMDVTYDVGQGPAVVSALTAWAASQPAPLIQDKAAESTQEFDGTYVTTNWVGYTASTRMGLSLAEKKKLDGTPYGKGVDVASVQFSFRGLSDQDRQASQ